MQKRDYKVVITTSKTQEFLVGSCNSPDEAEAIAEEWQADGEEGIVVFSEVTDMDAYPIDSEEGI